MACAKKSDKPVDISALSNAVATTKKKSKVHSGIKPYKQYCFACHGIDGKLGVSNASDLSATVLTKKQIIGVVRNGRGTMIPYMNILKEDEIDAVSDYILTNIKKD